MPDSSTRQLDELLGEDPAAVREREQTTFDKLAGPFRHSLVLFGAGGLGRRTLAGLRRLGVTPLAFTDNNQQLWHKEVDGLTVLPPEEAARKFAQRAAFVVTIWSDLLGHPVREIADHLKTTGDAVVISFVPLYWKYPEAFLPYFCLDLPHKICAQADDIRRAAALWCDESSRSEYMAQLRWRLWGDFRGFSPPSTEAQYFPSDLFNWEPSEVFVDCGAYSGDTIKSLFHAHGSSFKGVIALEPDPDNYAKLQHYVGSLDRDVSFKIRSCALAASAKQGTLIFSALGSVKSGISASGNVVVEAARLDDILADGSPTYIKLDIEGAESDALIGAERTIKRDRPMLAIAVYHAPDHLWRLTLLAYGYSKHYRFALRRYAQAGWETICYAIPRSRFRGRVRPERQNILMPH